ncbi:hypothetical protein C943_01483 [Mariniradius saccharolyticus AK6]|uniref:Beta-lactamase-related domain-containing protein n=1 Tax=Mariniradius saccharolyticus AK6 TaxID=1239962 RepID=M7Y4P0_9BACT|nr:serine hydrolase [Mariniradius saccharolyticus]EMS32221.1 hypothetical protein C943_01483 [Mariniradius saccharolyticus AK6]
MKKYLRLIIPFAFLGILCGCLEDSDSSSADQFSSLDARIEETMEKYKFPGVQVAIMKNERLVYQNSFGFAEVESSARVTNKSLFRIASISKPITAIGILKLVKDSKLELDSKVFGEGAILGTKFGAKPYSEAVKSITVRHLLEHKAGGWPNDANDPMFLAIHYPQHQLIGYVLDTRPLSNPPGSTIIYSNFGYCILGRIIEEVSGENYETYIKKNVLEPYGITSMHIGRNFDHDKHENEVKYYNRHSDYSPYQIDVKRMDSGGGWIGSATDLLRFMARIDRLHQKEDMLDEYFLNQMYFRFSNWFHYGAMSGTSGVLERVNDNFSFSVLANGNSLEFGTSLDAFRRVIYQDLQTRTDWPDHDLFDNQ